MNKNRSKSTISFLALILCIAVFMTGCGYSKLEVDEKIADVSEQIEALKNSIPTLEKTDEDLGRYIDALEETAEELDGKLAEANTAIETLRRELLAQLKKDIETSEGKTTAKVTVLETSLQTLQTEILKEAETIHTAITALKEQKNALEARIVTLKAYTDEKLTETADWATATFSTLEQYEATQTEIATVKENIRTLESDLKAAEERLNEKIKNDIAVAIDALREELSDDYVARIEAAVSDVTDAYSTAIEDAKKTVTGEYRTAIAEAIKDSESSMEAWVNKTLADGYYDIATIDAKLAALNDALSGADEGLQKQIDAQIAALDAAKKDLTDAYTAAITEAIETNNGVLRAEIAQAVADAAATLERRLAVIDNAVAGIQAEITAIKSDITSILSQLEALKNADVANRELIDQLKKDMEQQLEALQIQINCLKGDHVIDGEVVYTWSADQSTCTATATCVRCGEITETVLSVLNGTTYTATFTNDCFATQTAERKVARITGMTVVGDTVIIDEATKTIIAVIPDGEIITNFTVVATGENFHLMDDSLPGAYRFYIGDQYLVFESRYAVSEMKIEMPVSAGVLEGALKYSNDGGATTVDTGYYFRSINAADYVTTVTTLDELKAALVAGGNVKLGADLAISEEILRVEAGVSVVLDLAGKKITTTDATSILNLGTLTVKDSVGGGEISASSDVGVAAVINNGALTVEGGAIVASYSGIHNLTSGALTVKGGDISAPFPIELAGGTFALVGDAFTLTSTESGWGEIAWYGSEIDLSGVTGGEVAVEPQADGLDLSKITLPTGWKLYNADGTEATTTVEYGVLTAKEAITSGGGSIDEWTTVTTKAELEAALTAGGKIKLGADIDLASAALTVREGKTVILDLAGKEISVTDNTAIINRGTLTVRDSVGGGKITATGDLYGVSCIDSSGTLTVEGGKIEGNDSPLSITSGTASIEGGTFSGIKVYIQSGTLTVSGGVFDCRDYAIYNYGGTLKLVGNGYTLNEGAYGVQIAWGSANADFDFSEATGAAYTIESYGDGYDLSKITLPTGWKLYNADSTEATTTVRYGALTAKAAE